MAKLTRKLWIGIGAVTHRRRPAAASSPRPRMPRTRATSPPTARSPLPPGHRHAEGGEAYLTDGGPKDTRIRFYRDIALMRGHLLVGDAIDRARGCGTRPCRTSCTRPRSSTASWRNTSSCTRSRPFSRDLQALAQAVKAKRKGAYDRRLRSSISAFRARSRWPSAS